MRDISTPARHEFAARAELFIDALGATLAGTTDDAGAVQPSIRRIGQVIAEAARDAGIFDIEAMAVELAAAAHIQRSQIVQLIDLIESTVSDRPPRRSILVVEDDDISAMVLHAIGHETHSVATVANTLAQAREALTGWVPDLIVLDLFLPDGDGRSLLAELRSDPRLSQVPVIIISGFDHELARAESLALGADRFIRKPFEPEALMTIFNGIKPHGRRVSSALVTRGLLLREFSAGVGDQTVAMIRFHPMLGPHHPLPQQALAPAAETLALSLTGAGLVSEWSDGLFCAVIDRSVQESHQLLDEVRRKLRNETPPGGATTFTAGLIDATGEGFMRAIGSANGLLERGEQDGGDRIARKRIAERPTIVLAEDDSLIAALVSGRLDARGFDVDVVGDGLAAIDHISQTRPSLVLLDLFMPGADGFDVLRKLKGDDATADIPVIILTGADGESSVVKAFELGAADYVVKPFSPAELMVRIERFFR